MTLKLNQKGFSAVEGLLIVVIVAIIGAAGYYVYQAQNKTNDTINAANLAAQSPVVAKKPALTKYTFPTEKLSISYDAKKWEVSEKASATSTPCGTQDSLILQQNQFKLGFNFVECGKGGGICFSEPNSGCVRESESVANVKVSSGHLAYVIVTRSSVDSGKTWAYEVDLSKDAQCKASICTYTGEQDKEAINHIGGSYIDSTAPTSLSAFKNLPEVKSAIEVLKTAHY